jgi:hypothetical protein
VIASDTEEKCRAPVKSRKYARTTAIPFRAAAATTTIPAKRLASMAPSTSSSDDAKPSVPGNPTLARPVTRKHTASIGECS